MLQLLGSEIQSNCPFRFSHSLPGFDRLKHQGRGQPKLHRCAALSSCLQLGLLSSQGVEFGLEELERAEPAGQELQLPAGWVQSEQSHMWQPSPCVPTALSRDLKLLVGLHVHPGQQGEIQDWRRLGPVVSPRISIVQGYSASHKRAAAGDASPASLRLGIQTGPTQAGTGRLRWMLCWSLSMGKCKQ